MFHMRMIAEWGDCDPAGIVFYPRYFGWMDAGFQALLRARGLSQQTLRERFGTVTPLVEVGASFRGPVRPGDALTVAIDVEAWEERRFRVSYAFDAGESVVAEGFEVRAWANLAADGTLRGARVDPIFRQLLS